MKEESLFSLANQDENTPLADRVRPQSLDEFVGQKDLIGKGKILRELIEKDKVPSLILWGPPGTGKTTLAEIIAKHTKAHFITFSAVTSSIKDIRKIMEEAESNRQFGEKTIVFIDEIHRFNKAQQDAFLPFVEQGSITLIGATTENPSFEVNSALLSRAKVFVLHSLSTEDIVLLLKRAIKNPNGFPGLNIKISDENLHLIAEFGNGDARSSLNTLEIAVLNGKKSGQNVVVDEQILKELMNTKSLRYDKKGEEHYNLISALHKSMRNSDVNAAVYWVNRMLDGGEDPLYIARRLVRFASEDVGLADTNSLNVAINTFQACKYIGMPECGVHLTECVIYLACTPKSNSVYIAQQEAEKAIKRTGNLPVPLQIRNPTTKLMKDLNYGKDYQYAQDAPDKLTNMKTFPPELEGSEFYHPSNQGNEIRFKRRLEQIKEWHKKNG
ncbi:replication-associated recombination protein A [Lactobacillus ultunensis]|uniref:Recombination factor protein RarA n=1 Tax=Lactobacillus ultunensis DSM 16047 TaxID=525365 RepID=C2EK60_9LACO|nr:replication-associated recombination protein A [Lactobacillus ultunensis]EEJ73075.1 recombination factor protein RarA [Lactobacillus ultunensis DSM 16047]KRL82656.1 recombination ATPase [Lactobacillus ultunensis DSM 16047]QQP29407.1 replication-associated recombination protein A [Lactobacillus ultunensis]